MNAKTDKQQLVKEAAEKFVAACKALGMRCTVVVDDPANQMTGIFGSGELLVRATLNYIHEQQPEAIAHAERLMQQARGQSSDIGRDFDALNLDGLVKVSKMVH